MSKIKEKIDAIHQKLKQLKCDPILLGVSKGQEASQIREAFHAGIQHFGENYWQEAKGKIASLQDLAISWHFIGPIQSNKCKDIALHFDWVDSVDRASIALKLNQYRQAKLAPLQVCIQVNLEHEATKSGCTPEQVFELADLILGLPHLQLRGLMAIPKEEQDPELQKQSFQALFSLFKQVNQYCDGKLDTLSMGMSQDWHNAVLCGSSCIRIGRALFGERPKKEVLS